MIYWRKRTTRTNRWRLIALALVCFLVYSSFNHGALPLLPPPDFGPLSLKTHMCPSYPPNPPYKPRSHGKFDWSAVPQKHPVDNLITIPAQRRPKLPEIQFDFRPATPESEAVRRKQQSAVKASFERGWNAYKKKAWGMDEVRPISGKGAQTLGGWAATLVDNLDTLWIMGMRDEYDHAVKKAVELSFAPGSGTNDPQNLFETIIRQLGGMIAAYDVSGCRDEALLDKAIELGDMVYKSFDTPNRMPATEFSPSGARDGAEQYAPGNGCMAEIGTIQIEFTRLSQITGDMKYFDAISRITDVMYEQQNKTLLPGMWSKYINTRDTDLTVGNVFTLGGTADSAFEYIGKMYQLLGGVGHADKYRKMYEHAMDTAMAHLFYRPMTPENADILLTGEVTVNDGADRHLAYVSEHLACFVGGMLLLGGKLFANDTHLDFGRKTTAGCVWAYEHTPAGIMSETSTMSACPSLEQCPYKPRDEKDTMPGFAYVQDPRYLLRPEAIESVFYLYRITGDPKIQETAWSMFEAIESHTKTEYGNAQLVDVTNAKGAKQDNMESFWLAETLKYFYLIFAEPDLISLDEFVFNTEAHPMRLGI